MFVKMSTQIFFSPWSKTTLGLKLFAAVATLAGGLLMAFDHQTTSFGGYQIHATFNISSAFKFFVGGNLAACVYCLLSLPFDLQREKDIIIYTLDLMTTCVLMASASAASSISLVGKYGNETIGWPSVCRYYTNFCNRAAVALGLSYVGFISMLVMCSCCFIFEKLKPSNSRI